MPDDHRSLNPNPVRQTRMAHPEHGVWRARSIATLILLALMVISFSACTTEARKLEEQFTTTADPNVRLTCLAKLLKLPGQEPMVRELFNSLNQEDKLAVVKSSEPQDATQELVPVVKVLYVDLLNDLGGNDLLRAMNGPLRDLNDPTAHSLSTEIDRWLEGRASYSNGKHDVAVAAYTRAIEINSRNPGTRLDRALAYARLGQSIPALDDLAEVARLNSSPAWKSRVQQALLGNQALYSALWVQKEKYAAVAALVTEPTRTPISTTPAPSRTPIPTILTALPAMPTPTDTPATRVAPTATPPPTVVPRMTSPSYSATCRNPVTLRWSGTLQWYEHYRVRVRYKSSEAGTVDLLTSERLRVSEWQTRLPEQVNVGGTNYTVFGMIEWRVLIYDGRTGETVSASDWIHFYFNALSGESCP